DRERWAASMRHIALEGRCFVVSVGQYTTRSGYPDDYPIEAEPDEVLIGGGSCIVDPHGRFLVEPYRDGEAVLVGDVDLGEIPRATFDLDVVGHYARPDVFRLVVNEEPQRPVSFS
ncbi:MAG TPA: nitrilase, partial [Actinobacteria bacterium]|nr:nitrilase [Actinomycetota bacterium]